ncbi:YceI family protein [Tsukamurella sp. 8F]|uniref:YceI family protein n=1 Tax=unclassified Tsukamurella TaxID=2633480 RepID=UPI0023BA3007|nr:MULTISPECIES: YceI family protein [unclassified Tsukamurella]MDF0531524.1 YceI family protein [Tsukamurella sp. 8J]MDF0588768.1 YceI family protein [Tsukamurella sp. 8F]
MSTVLEPSTWTIDPVHSSVDFSVRHLMVSKVRGQFGTFSGTITVAADGTASATAEVDVTSVDTRNEQRDAHIRTADFFDAENHPKATFVSTAVTPKGSDYVLAGELTIRGTTRPVEFELEYLGRNPGMGQGEVVAFEATTVITRQDFGITIDMPLETGGKVIGDKITLTLEIEALRQA